MTFFHRIWIALKGDRRLIVASVCFGLVFTGLGILPPLLVREMILQLQHPETASGFLLLGGLVAGIYLLRGGARYLYGLSSHIAAYRTLHRLMGRVFAHLQRQPPSFFHKTHSGELVARSVGDVQEIEDFIAHGIPETLLAIVIPLTMSVVLFVLNWRLALIALLPLPLAAGLAYGLTRRVRNYWVRVRRRFAGLSATMQDHLTGLSTVQSFTAEKESAAKIERESRQYRDSIVHANRWSLLPAGIVETASGGGLVLLICAGTWMTGADNRLNIDVADLVVFVMYLGRIFMPFLRLANLTEQLQKSAASAERVFELLDTQPEITDSPVAAVPANPAFDIAFDGVQFAYDSNPAVLHGTSFDVVAGETVAVVGVTGAGKTTLCHLLLRFFDVSGGEIRLGGDDIRLLPLDYLRSQIAFVSQDVFLFQGTIRENLLLGNPAATEAELLAAADAAHCLEFIETFPQGFETIVGERGVRLSGGQKQRVAIARALLKDAPVLVLDEATSAVDSETESVIRTALTRVFAGRTVLIVAHRLSTIQAADRIVVLDEGRIVEVGSYEELTTRDGQFARLCRVQENAIW